MKKRWISLIILIIALVVAGGAWFYQKHHTPKDLIHYKDPGFTADETKQFDDQIKSVESKIQGLSKDTAPKDKLALYMQLGSINYSLGRFDEAKKAFEQGTKQVADNASPWHELFVVENAMHDYKAARTSIEKAVSLNDSNAQFWLDRIDLMKNQFNYNNDQLDSLYKEALDKTHNAADVVVAYAKFLETKNDLVGSIKYWRMAEDINPGSKQLYEQEVQRIQNILK